MKRAKLSKFNGENFDLIFKAIISELDRRSLPQDRSQLSAKELCEKYLYPKLTEKITKTVNKKLQSETGFSTSGKVRKRELKEARKREKYDLEAKVKLPWLWNGKWVTSDETFKICSTFLESVKEKIIKKQKWIKIINDPKSCLSDFIDGRCNDFFKYHKWIKYYVSFFMGEDNLVYQSLDAKKLPMSKIEITATMLQNLQYPK